MFVGEGPMLIQKPTIYSRKYFSPNAHLQLKGSVLAESYEKELAKYYEHGDGSKSLLIDFQHAEFIEIAALVNCIATSVDRHEKGLETYLGFPKYKSVRDFLKVWRFPDAFEEALNEKFTEFLLHEDHELLEESQTIYSGIGDAVDALEFNPDWQEGDISKRNFFEFITFSSKDKPITAQDFPLIPKMESKRWALPLIQQVLKKHLGSSSTNPPKADVARVIIYEAMSNAIRHPKAKTIQVVSRFYRKENWDPQAKNNRKKEKTNSKKLKVEGSLRICIWDDGETIAETLLKIVTQGRSVRSMCLPEYMCDRVYVKLKRIRSGFEKTLEKELTIDQSENLSKETANEARALLLSMFPGITRTVDDPKSTVKPYDDLDTNTEDNVGTLVNFLNEVPGMGLYALTRTALDQFQGSLFIRSGNFCLHKQVAHDTYRVQHNVRYKCTITQYPDYFPPFKGNLISIQLPIKDSV